MIKRKPYKSYHTDFQLAVCLDQIPDHKLSIIPKSTKSYLKKLSPEKFADLVGSDYSSNFDFSNPDLPNKIDLIKKFADCLKTKKKFKAALIIKHSIITIITIYKNDFKNIIVKQKIVNTINRVKNTIGFDKALKYFNIKKQTFYSWTKQISLKCTSSLTGKCLKIWPTQLSKIEVDSIKKLFLDKFKIFNNLHSTWGYGFKNNIITVGKSTFLDYVKKLDLAKNIHKFKKPYKIGLVTSRPNEAWNADLTCVIPENRIKLYVYLLIDHFSKYILSWLVADKVSSKLRKQTVEDAYKKYGNHNPKIIYADTSFMLNEDIKDRHFINLVTDGGPENHGDLSNYIAQPDVNIVHNIAGKDVTYSNSPIEALNKILKYQFLYLNDIPDINALIKHLEYWIPIYNDERPNRAGSYLLTPNEIYNGKTIDKIQITNRINQAKIDRINYNKINSCGLC